MAAEFVFETDILKVDKALQDKIIKFPQLERRALKKASSYMAKETKMRFDRQSGPDNVPWKPLHPLTRFGRKKGKGRAGKGQKALLDTGTLRRSIVATFVYRNEVMIGPKEHILFGSYVGAYPRIQQGGATWKRSKKQAWWMVFNLFGFDPDKPWLFTRQGSVEGRRKQERAFKRVGQSSKYFNEFIVVRKTKTRRLKKKEKKILGFFGWRKATVIAKSLLEHPAVIPARPFAGANEDNIKQMETIIRIEAWKFFVRRSGSLTTPPIS